MAKKKLTSKPADRHLTPRRQVYLPVELADRVAKLAALNKRPLNWQVKLAVEMMIEQHNANAKPGDRV